MGAVTSNRIVHKPPPAIEPLEKATDVAAAAGANVGAPQPLTEALGVAATFMAPGVVGNTSVRATPLMAWLPLALEMVMVTVDVLPVPMVAGLKALLSTGGARVAMLAVAVLPVSALGPVALTAPLVLTYAPTANSVMLTLTMQVPPAAMLPPENVSDTAAAAGAKVGAPQPVVLVAGVPATRITPGLVGKVSVNATPVSAVVGLALLMVKVRVDVPLTAMGVGEKSLAMLGATTLCTTTLAVLLTAPLPALALLTTPVVLL